MSQGPPFPSKVDVWTQADNTFEWWWIADGLGVDFTGCTGTFSARVCPDDPAPLFVGTVVLGAVADNPGLVQLLIPRTALAGVVVPVAHGDVLLTMSDGSRVEFAPVDVVIHQGSSY